MFPRGNQAVEMNKILAAWREQAAKLESGEISQDEYDQWRYCYPTFDTTQRWSKVPSQELSKALTQKFIKPAED